MAQTQTNGADAPDMIKPPPGVIIPPPEVRSVLEKTASIVGRRGEDMEARILETQKGNAKIQFLHPDNPYNAYYLWRKHEIAEGRGFPGEDGSAPQPAKVKKGIEPPPEFHFSARMPTISAVDLEVVKLTARWVAKNGRSWMTALSQRENGNSQFDFLRPQHSFHPYFSRLVDQYTDLLTGDSVDGGRPQAIRVAELKRNVNDKYHNLERARKRAEWSKYQEKQKVKQEEEHERERIEYAQIDWHDFSVVGTVEFTEADELAELPPPQSLNDLQSLSLEQKQAVSLAPANRRIEETLPDMDEFYGYQQPPQAQVYQTTQMPPPPQAPYVPSPQPDYNTPGPYPPPRTAQDDEDDARIAERAADRAERERAAQVQAAAKGTGPMRIRNDYVPRAQARRQGGSTVLCPNCNQQVPVSEYEHHVKGMFCVYRSTIILILTIV